MDNNNNMVNSAQTSVPATKTGWSWGGFMFTVVVMLASKRYVYLLLYLLMFIPIVNLIAIIGIMIWMGVKARSLVMASPAFTNHDEAVGFMKGIDHAGKIMLFILIILIVLGIILGATLTTLLPFKLINNG